MFDASRVVHSGQAAGHMFDSSRSVEKALADSTRKESDRRRTSTTGVSGGHSAFGAAAFNRTHSAGTH
jgi:hypothetical protein